MRYVVRLRGGVRRKLDRRVRLSEAQRSRGESLGLVRGRDLRNRDCPGLYVRHVRRSGDERPGERRQRWERYRYRERRRLFFLRTGPCGWVLLRRLSPARGQRSPHKRGCSGKVHPGGFSPERHLLHHRARGQDMHALRALNAENPTAVPCSGPRPCSSPGPGPRPLILEKIEEWKSCISHRLYYFES